MNISVFGLGYVGCVSLGCLAQNGHRVIGVDVNPVKVDLINQGKPTIIEKDIDTIIEQQFRAGTVHATLDYAAAIHQTSMSIVAVGTPSTSKGELNLAYLLKVAEQIGDALQQKNSFYTVAIRSTVPPGTGEKIAEIIAQKSQKIKNVDFAVVSNPEFLREGTAVHDYFNPPFTLIGTDSPAAAKIVGSLYEKLPGEIIITDVKIAEILKFVNNAFHALKITFANEVGNVCQAEGIDSHRVMEIFMKDKQLNISPAYLKPGFAYGGSCLPKDLKGLLALARKNFVEAPVIENIDRSNFLHIKKTVDLIMSFRKKKIAFLGLAFKAGTDDLRNSPSVSVIETLIGKGHTVKIYDKNVQLSQLGGTNKEFIHEHIPHLANLIVSSIDDVLQDSEVIVIATNEPEFRGKLRRLKNAVVVDLVRLGEGLPSGENYVGICW